MENITTGITSIMGIVTTMLDTILGNPVFAALFASGFIGIALGIVRKMKKTAH